MIPKRIHYCWFGGNPLPASAVRCIESWKRLCPDYEIIEWNEENFDVHCNAYCAAMYAQKKWAFLTDYARLKVVYENGGVYFDTDVELICSPDPVMDQPAFMGMETTSLVNTGLGFGAEKGAAFLRENMAYYEHLMDFSEPETCPVITTKLLSEHGFHNGETSEIQRVVGITIYPPEYFCAKHTHTGLVTITQNTISIHHFDATWNTPEQRRRTLARWRKYRIEYICRTPKRMLRKWIGDERVDAIKRILRG